MTIGRVRYWRGKKLTERQSKILREMERAEAAYDNALTKLEEGRDRLLEQARKVIILDAHRVELYKIKNLACERWYKLGL